MRDREPHNWSLPLPWRPLGVSVRVHILFPCVAIGIVLWVATSRQFAAELWPFALTALAILFFSVLLHEFGHIFGARRVDGDVPDILIWPLGGLAFADVPHAPRAYFWATITGPAVNLGLALAAAGGLAAIGFVAPFNPMGSPLNPRMYNWRDQKVYASAPNPGEAEYYYCPNLNDPERLREIHVTFGRTDDGHRYLAYPTLSSNASEPVELKTEQDQSYLVLMGTKQRLETARLTRWQWLLAQFFAVNWLLFCVNLLPAFPLDGARLLQAWLWRRTDYRQGTATAAYVGFLMMLGVGIFAIVIKDILTAGLAGVIYLSCRQQLLMLERNEEESAPGYDFGEDLGETEREERPAPPPPRLSWFQRWQRERAERRRLRDLQQREVEERRLDDLLDKIHRHGRQSLTEEELRFLTRVSGRYPNRK